MPSSPRLEEKWIRTGVVSGLLVSVIYPVLIFVPLPELVQTFLIMFFGPLLGLSSVGLFKFIVLHKKSLAAQAAVVSNIIAGALITTMLLVQVAVRSSLPPPPPAGEWILKSFNNIHLGLDVAWDVYIGLGTLLFAVSMFNHPKLGKIFSLPGIVISLLLIVLNAVPFPVPPADAGLFDIGPLAGLWYLGVTVAVILNFKWVREKTA